MYGPVAFHVFLQSHAYSPTDARSDFRAIPHCIQQDSPRLHGQQPWGWFCSVCLPALSCPSLLCPIIPSPSSLCLLCRILTRTCSFETRDICEKVIKNFHGMSIGHDNFIMQVRYADTPAQKELKRITAERRQYRTNEYNIGAYGTPAVGMNPSIYNTAMWNRRPGPLGYR